MILHNVNSLVYNSSCQVETFEKGRKMIKVNIELAKAVAAEVKLNLDCFTFDTATSKNKALHDLLTRLYDDNMCYNNQEWYDIQAIYHRYMRSDMEHLFNVEAEILTYIDKYFNNDESDEVGLTD